MWFAHGHIANWFVKLGFKSGQSKLELWLALTTMQYCLNYTKVHFHVFETFCVFITAFLNIQDS